MRLRRTNWTAAPSSPGRSPPDRPRTSHCPSTTTDSAAPSATCSNPPAIGRPLDASRSKASPGRRRQARTRPELSGNARRYGLIDGRTAQDYGYHLPASGDSRPQETDKRVRACKERASEQLLKGAEKIDHAWFDGLNFTSADRSAAAPEVVRATAEWSRCMQSAGFAYADPLAAISDRHWNLDSPTVSASEITVATTDVHCKVRTHLVIVRVAAETRIQQQLISAAPTRFAAIERANQQILANAQLLLVG